MIQLHNNDCLKVLSEMEDNSVDSIVTDPPYGINFMGNKWDCDVPSVEIWKECLRVLKHGGHLLAFAGTRTQHRMAVNIEDAGFEIRDMIAWVYGTGFPKSMDVSKNIDKEAGVVRKKNETGNTIADMRSEDYKNSVGKDISKEYKDTPNTKEAQQWDGWGTALKPALEPITLARKPISEKTVAANVLKWGTGAINIDNCRIEHNEPEKTAKRVPRSAGWNMKNTGFDAAKNNTASANQKGRFPANLIHDGSQHVLDLFPESKGQQGALKGHARDRVSSNGIYGKLPPSHDCEPRDNKGSAARFFYCAKAQKHDRDQGVSGKNQHPTVKPTSLMRYLVRLVTPPNGIVVDPFMGSGSTGKACRIEKFSFIGMEIEKESFDVAKQRIEF